MRDPYEKPARRTEPPPEGLPAQKQAIQRTSKVLVVPMMCDRCLKSFDFVGHASELNEKVFCGNCSK